MGGRCLLLIARDDRWAAAIDHTFTLRGYTVVRVRTGAAALTEGAGMRPEAIFTEMELADLAGPQLCRSLCGADWADETMPIVVMTPPSLDAGQRLALFHAGAWDVVGSSSDPEESAARVEHYVAARRSVERARQDGLVDPSTGLYNERGLARRCEELVAEAYRRHAALACLAVGPGSPGDLAPESAEGESAALYLVQALQSVRRSDVTGRQAPGEFVIVAPRTDALGAVGLARRLRNSIHAMHLRVGYDAVPNVREAPVSPNGLIKAALHALRHTSTAGPQDRSIRPYRPLEHRPPDRH